VGQAHGREDNAERLPTRGCLGGHLGGELQVRQAGDGKDRQLLAADQRGQRVDGRHTSEHRLGRGLACGRIDREPGDRCRLIPGDQGAAIGRLATPVTHPAEPFLAHRNPQWAPAERDVRGRRVNAGRALHHLHDSKIAVGLEDQPVPGCGPALQPDRGELVPADAAHAADDEERTPYLGDVRVLWLGPRCHDGTSAVGVACSASSRPSS
jgi:hypothetical protein